MDGEEPGWLTARKGTFFIFIYYVHDRQSPCHRPGRMEALAKAFAYVYLPLGAIGILLGLLLLVASRLKKPTLLLAWMAFAVLCIVAAVCLIGVVMEIFSEGVTKTFTFICFVLVLDWLVFNGIFIYVVNVYRKQLLQEQSGRRPKEAAQSQMAVVNSAPSGESHSSGEKAGDAAEAV